MKPTPNQLANLTKAWSKVAEEEIKIEYIDDAYYAYGSELGCLRLEHNYNSRPKAQAGYSKNLNTWYFKLEKNSEGL